MLAEPERQLRNKPDYIEDTIVATATAPGTGGIAIARLSGPAAQKIGRRIAGKLSRPRQATLSVFRDAEDVALDEGIALYFPAPYSYTGEAVVELQCHGGPTVVAAVVEAAVKMGARQALPGEFSKRAFLNNKLDLVQAEAVADLIGSSTRQAAAAALRSLSGAFSKTVEKLLTELTALRVHTEAALDFPEEEIDFLADDALRKKAEDCAEAFAALLETASVGRVLRDGFQLVIIGRPNAGKSSLLNTLSGQPAAIVTEVAGTTRDILREHIELDGLAVELVDTAGLRDDPDRLEAEGIRRARDAISKADAILWIQDASVAATESIAELEPTIEPDTPVIKVRNKIDLTGEAGGVHQTNPVVVNISAESGQGLDALRDQIQQLAGYKNLGEGAFTARRRHIRAIESARTHFTTGRDALLSNSAGEIFAEEMRLAQLQLGSITGRLSSDDLLGKIFSEFCIGK